MKFAVNVNQQFREMTGIQHYTDSLLDGLYALDSPHEITAFAPNLPLLTNLDALSQDGMFAWWRRPGARMDTAGNTFQFKDYPLAHRNALTLKVANVLDGRLVPRVLRRLRGRRTDVAARRYDLMHFPEPLSLASVPHPPARSVVTIYDTTIVSFAHAHAPSGIAEWVPYFEFARKRSARVLTISEFSKGDIVQHLGIPADRIDVTPLAARASTRRVTDPQEINPTLAKFGLTDTPFVLYAGTLEPRKNLGRLVEAFAQVVLGDRLHDHKLVLAGGKWEDHDLEMHRRAESLGVGDRLVTTGYISNDEMNSLMSSCASFAYVSEYEGFGLPPLEAMVCGAPVVASSTTSLPEVVGEAGLQVDPTDVGAIAGALHCLLTDGAENVRRRSLSLARASEFSWERTARLTLQSYEAAAN